MRVYYYQTLFLIPSNSIQYKTIVIIAYIFLNQELEN